MGGRKYYIARSGFMTKRKLRKQQIMQAAIEVFGKFTYQNANISEIARKAGIAEGTIYQYFKNKQDLFFSIGRERTKDFCRQIDLCMEGVSGTEEKIKKFVWYYLYYFKTNPDYVRSLMLEMRVSRDFVKSRGYKTFRALSKLVLEILKEGQEEGVVRKDMDIYLAEQLLLGILEHIVTRWLLKGEKYDVLQYYEQVSDLVLNGLCGGTGIERPVSGAITILEEH
jgi:TetR/AcrR family transcriptional regulator, fatty acid metabolism regulator protein